MTDLRENETVKASDSEDGVRTRSLAIIPARGGSKGIPRKNLQQVGGKPLVGWAIEQAIECASISDVLVSTEDEEIRLVSEQFGARVMDRPSEFHHDNSIQEVDRLLVWTIREYEKIYGPVDVVALLYPTAPLRRVETIDKAVEMVASGRADSCLSLYEDTSYLWAVEKAVAKPVNYDPKLRGPRQKEHWNQWVENKAVYAMTRSLILDTGCRLGGRIGYVEMSKIESIDVDSPQDLELVRVLLEKR